MNRSYVKPNDGCPAYLDTLRRIGEFATDGGNGTTRVHVSNDKDRTTFINECKKWKIIINNVNELEFIIQLPFHNYRYIPEARIFKINNNLDFF